MNTEGCSCKARDAIVELLLRSDQGASYKGLDMTVTQIGDASRPPCYLLLLSGGRTDTIRQFIPHASGVKRSGFVLRRPRSTQ